jgi:hypothetical protein
MGEGLVKTESLPETGFTPKVNLCVPERDETVKRLRGERERGRERGRQRLRG